MIVRINKPKNNHNGNTCYHHYDIIRVVMDHPEGGVVVFGSDYDFHVVHKNCVGDRKREIGLNTQRKV